MKVNRLLTVMAALLVAAVSVADNNDEIKKKIADIKKSNQYLYAETTAATEEEAHGIAEEMLYDEINKWAAKKKKLQNSANLAVNNKQSLWATVSLPRGNMFRVFIYVMKSDILPVENSEVIGNVNTAPETGEAMQSAVEEIYPEPVIVLAGCTEYADFAAKIKKLKAEGKVKSYARYAQVDNPEPYYLAIYNKEGKVVAVLSPGSRRHNVSTGQIDSVTNYSGCGAICFMLNE